MLWLRKNNQALFIGALFILIIPSLLGVFHPGFFISDDGSWMVIRLSAFYSGLVSGQFPTRFLPQLNLGYGYPVSDFLYPLFLYMGSLLHILKIPFTICIKLLFAGGLIGSALGTYLWLKSLFGKLPSLVGAIVYLYFPYHLFDMYTRGSLGEIISIGIVPFILWAMERKSFLLTALFLACIILAHNTLAVFFLPVTFVYALLRKKNNIAQLIFIYLFALGISSFFWIPALYDKQFTVFDSIGVANPFAYFARNPLLLGQITLAGFVGLLLVKQFWKNQLSIFFISLALFSIFLSLPISSVIWNNHFLATYVQFPFRFLSITMVSISFFIALALQNAKKQILFALVFLLFIGYSAFPYLFPKTYSFFPESYYITNGDTTTVKAEYMPRWVKVAPVSFPNQKIKLISGKGTTNILYQKGTNLILSTNLISQATIEVETVYFPGWQAVLDDHTYLTIAPGNPNGTIRFSVPSGNHMIHVYFSETPVRLFADVLTLMSFVFLLFVARRVKKYETN